MSMTDHNEKQLVKTLWSIADTLRGAMNADDLRDYMLAFLFLRYLPGLRNFDKVHKLAVDAWAKYDNVGASPVLLEWGENQ